jgi:hypothetical protein
MLFGSVNQINFHDVTLQIRVFVTHSHRSGRTNHHNNGAEMSHGIFNISEYKRPFRS